VTVETIPAWQSLVGGALIGTGAAALRLFNGEIAGISGIVDSILHRTAGDQAWRVAFVAGLLLPVAVLGSGPVNWQARPAALAVAGILVGYGTRLGSGCTSGHGVCGIANLSLRSLTATVTFVGVAAITVAVCRWLGGQ
jgi:uncharacterized membrane protein YedE/YeeE